MPKLPTLLALLFLSVLVTVKAQAAPPNIVFIFIDDMGYADPSCFGNPHVQTPHIDRMAKEGMKLTNFYVNSPICSPSRVAVTTGQYPSRWKIHSFLSSRISNETRGMRNYLDKQAPTTAKKLKAAGYATAHFGKWHIGGGRDVDDSPLPSAFGFDESLVAFEGLGDRLLTNPKNSSTKLGHGKIEFCKRWEKTEKYTDRAIDFIRRNQDRPFYVHLFPNDVHDPHNPWPDQEEKWKSVTDNKWEQVFFPVLEEMDKQIGRLVDTIDQLGLAEKTLIVFTSDNGPTDWAKYYREEGDFPPGFTGPFRGRKWSLYEGGIRMPFVARWKGKIPAGVTDDASVVSGIDLSPTFCSLAGVAENDASDDDSQQLDGIDCSQVLLGKPSGRSKPLFWQYGAPHANLKAGKASFQSPTFAVRDRNWKLLVNPDGTEAQLFDLKEDPSEKKNLLERERDLANTLQQKIANWAKARDLEFDATAELKQPTETLVGIVNNQLQRFVNHGVQETAEEWTFDGSSWLALRQFQTPRINGGQWMRIQVTVDSNAKEGVILAHGGSTNGYSLFVKQGRLAFATVAAGKRSTISATQPLSAGRIEAFWQDTGEMLLKLDGKLIASGVSAGTISQQPEETMQVGVDLGQSVGDYTGPNHFTGKLSTLRLHFGRRRR